MVEMFSMIINEILQTPGFKFLLMYEQDYFSGKITKKQNTISAF